MRTLIEARRHTKMQHRKTNGLNTSALSLALLAACSIDDVDLGGSSSVEQNLEVGARCADSTLIERSSKPCAGAKPFEVTLP
jgi:hypothetical protein